MIRLAHLSDIHITAPLVDWKARDWFNKRLAAWMNLRLLGRGHRFRHADRVLPVLVAELAERRPDHVIFSGDATALGFESEIKRAAEMLGVGRDGPPGLAVPGNHDYCTREAEASGLFERYFAPWLVGERIGTAVYPFAQRVGPVSLIGLNSSTGNRLAWDAGGSVGGEQLERFRNLLAQLPAGPRIVVTHYPVCLSSGRREHRVHGLRDLPEVVSAAAEGGVSLWLHGHRHHAYAFQTPPQAPFPVICTGSATQTNLWSYGDYTLDGADLTAQRRVYNPATDRFEDGERFTLRLRV